MLARLSRPTGLAPSRSRVRIGELIAHFVDDLLSDLIFQNVGVGVMSESLSRYVDSRQQGGASNATINRELAALKRMFRLGLQSIPPKVLRLPSFPHLRENNVRKGFIEDSQFRKLVEGSELWFRTLVECGRTYGWRISELLNLRARQIDLAHRTIRLEPGTTKNTEGREVIMTEAVYVLLSACVSDKSPETFVFTRSNGKRV